MILIKDDSVKLRRLSPALMHIFNTLMGMNMEETPIYPKDWVITSINDGKHMKGSKHYIDEAVDLRSKNFKSLEAKKSFVNILQLRLGQQFTVLFENVDRINEHFHIQVKKGVIFNG